MSHVRSGRKRDKIGSLKTSVLWGLDISYPVSIGGLIGFSSEIDINDRGCHLCNINFWWVSKCQSWMYLTLIWSSFLDSESSEMKILPNLVKIQVSLFQKVKFWKLRIQFWAWIWIPAMQEFKIRGRKLKFRQLLESQFSLMVSLSCGVIVFFLLFFLVYFSSLRLFNLHR